MKKIVIILCSVLLFVILFALVSDPVLFNESIVDTLEIWLFKVYPSLFTFYMISAILLNLGIIDKITYYLGKRNVFLFNNPKALNLFLISILSGNPSSSSLIINDLDSKQIKKEEANNLLIYSSFISPLFILSFISNTSLAISIIIIHIISNFIIVLLINKKKDTLDIPKSQKFDIKSLLSSSMKAIEILLIVASIMTFCNIISYSINYLFDYLKINNKVFKVFLSFIEISKGTFEIINMDINHFLKLIILVFLFSFGGVSIHLQVYTIIKGKISYLAFLFGRIIQGLISVFLFIIIYYFFW